MAERLRKERETDLSRWIRVFFALLVLWTFFSSIPSALFWCCGAAWQWEGSNRVDTSAFSRVLLLGGFEKRNEQHHVLISSAAEGSVLRAPGESSFHCPAHQYMTLWVLLLACNIHQHAWMRMGSSAVAQRRCAGMTKAAHLSRIFTVTELNISKFHCMVLMPSNPRPLCTDNASTVFQARWYPFYSVHRTAHCQQRRGANVHAMVQQSRFGRVKYNLARFADTFLGYTILDGASHNVDSLLDALVSHSLTLRIAAYQGVSGDRGVTFCVTFCTYLNGLCMGPSSLNPRRRSPRPLPPLRLEPQWTPGGGLIGQMRINE